jgi:biotin synthase
MVSTMSRQSIDATNHLRLSELGRRVIGGGAVTREEALWLFHLEKTADVYDLLAWANRIREHFRGNKVHLCSIVNIKSGGCSENCRFCSQSAAYQTEAPRYGLVDKEAVLQAAEETAANGVTALGLVAAWRGLDEGPVLDQICESLETLRQNGKARPDASLGIIRSQAVADRLKASGLECYNHNLETSRDFFPKVCDTHAYEERIQTIHYMKRAGVSVCSGGILGLGESVEDRCELAFALRDLEVDFVPINILNPINGTPFANLPPLAPLKVLQSIACFRFILPRREIMVAGGRAINLRDLQSMMFMAGASAMMVGNYLTTLNQPVERDLQMLKDLGLETDWEKPDAAEKPNATAAAGHAKDVGPDAELAPQAAAMASP